MDLSNANAIMLMDEIAKLREEKFQLELELRRVKEEAAEVYRDWVDGKMPQE